jgi:hypothetical protein
MVLTPEVPWHSSINNLEYVKQQQYVLIDPVPLVVETLMHLALVVDLPTSGTD